MKYIIYDVIKYMYIVVNKLVSEFNLASNQSKYLH